MTNRPADNAPEESIADIAAATSRAGRIYQDFLTGIERRRVAPESDRDALRREFTGSIGEQGVGLGPLLDDFENLVLPNSMTTPHPRYAGLVNSTPLPAAPIADLLVSMLNNNGGAYHQSPAGTTAEEEVVRVFADLLGYPTDVSGLLLPGGTFANLHGLLLARTRAFPDWSRRGPAAAHEPRIYTSKACHFSVARIAGVLGVGEDQVVSLPIHGRGCLDVAALRTRVLGDRAAGATPFAVVATMGTTGTGALDDLGSIADVTTELGLWLHVDACYGGAAALLDELRPRFAGIEHADSVTVDPHKWFFMPIVAGLVLTRHRQLEVDSFRVDAPYIPGGDAAGSEVDAFRRGLPTSRRNSGLTVWAALRAHGLGTIRAAVRRNVDQCRRLEHRLADAGFSILPDGELSIACARWVPAGSDFAAPEVDGLQRRIAAAVCAGGEAWFATTVHEGRTWLRFNLVNIHTRDVHVDRIAEVVVETALRVR